MIQNREQLGRKLWSIAKRIKGSSVSADNFRDYMLSFLFLRILSDNYERTAKKELGDEYPDVNAVGVSERSPLSVWYERNPEDVPAFEERMLLKANCVIRPENLWNNIARMAHDRDGALLHELEAGLRNLGNESLQSDISAIFYNLDLASSNFGHSIADRNSRFCEIIAGIDEALAGISSEDGTLGETYEYLIERFAAASKNRSGEFYTPHRISDIVAGIVTFDSAKTRAGEESLPVDVMDFACGSGSMLLNVRESLGPGKIARLHGQDKNRANCNLARMNMMAHGVKRGEFEIHCGDTLANDWDKLRARSPKERPRFDMVVSNPPFSCRWDRKKEMGKDPRFRNYGLPPRLPADYAFLLHGFHYLDDDGVMAIILPLGALFREGEEAKIRRKLLENGNIDAVIGLPNNLFYSTGYPVCIIVLRKRRKTDDILFVNASELVVKGMWQSHMLGEHVERIVETYRKRPERIERFARRVRMNEIEANNFYLNVSRYVSMAEEEVAIDLSCAREEMLKYRKRALKSAYNHNELLKELQLSPLPTAD